MRIAVVSKADHFGGGASRVASELTTLLNQHGNVAHHWLSWAGSPGNANHRSLYGPVSRPVRTANLLLRRLGLAELLPFELGPLYAGGIVDYDLVHFHDLSSAISPLTLAHLGKHMPVAWTIHDCSPFTGGCLYPMSCVRFRQSCGQCPQIGQWPLDAWFDFTDIQRRRKQTLAQSGRIEYFTPSQWMADMASSSGMFATPPSILSNGVDTATFRPLPRAHLRQELGIANAGPLILISAGALLDERKGNQYAFSALRSLADLPSERRPGLLLVGHSHPSVREQLADFSIHETGYVGDARKLARYYAAADLFLFTSLADNQPLVVLETMATGTPVIGFQTGGIPEMVVQDVTGHLVAPKSTDALASILRQSLATPEILATWGSNAVERAQTHYSHEHFLNKHLRAYEHLLSKARSPQRRRS
jgi:glycosyltransferase involved in cell wall biosynthesis